MTLILSKLSRPAVSVILKFRTFRKSFIPSNRYRSSGKSGSRPFITWRSLAGTSTLTGILFYWMKTLRDERNEKMKIESIRSFGEASIGGPFELVNSENKIVTSEDLKGQWILIYFGFTNCPDVCPEELEKMTKVVDLVDENPRIPNILPVFISVDPDRDTPEMVEKYIAEFSPKFLGLAGNAEQVEKVTRAYRVYYSAGPKDPEQDYIVDHTVIMYLVDPDGKFVTYFGQTRDAQEIADVISVKMVFYKKEKEGNSES